MRAPRASALWSLRLSLLARVSVHVPVEADAAAAAQAPVQADKEPGQQCDAYHVAKQHDGHQQFHAEHHDGDQQFHGLGSLEIHIQDWDVHRGEMPHCKQYDRQTQHDVRDTVEKYCGGGDSLGAEPERVMVQSAAGILAVGDAARERVCASPLCRSAIVSFWEPVRGCSSIAYWRTNVALAWMTAKVQCAQWMQESGPTTTSGGSRSWAWPSAGPARAATKPCGRRRPAQAAALASLQAGAGFEDGEQLKVLCERVEERDVEPSDAPADSGGTEEGPKRGDKRCPQVDAAWPARGEEAVRLELGYVVLRFDQCVMAADSNLSLES
ncbi:unnamed protein product [Prorocentrum cordatum]|uniref:Uncharacterized protein n=1 Tax=Prorocentrum cordatum TaxID=2364126 RepID=A0ABN9WQY9_9DINO|nr:unnamed protein product [Polarella glacialis]